MTIQEGVVLVALLLPSVPVAFGALRSAMLALGIAYGDNSP
ncbi:hypothetical protein [Streptomyces sp. NPDC048641]